MHKSIGLPYSGGGGLRSVDDTVYVSLFVPGGIDCPCPKICRMKSNNTNCKARDITLYSQ